MKKLIFMACLYLIISIPAIVFGSPNTQDDGIIPDQTVQHQVTKQVIDENSIAGTKDIDSIFYPDSNSIAGTNDPDIIPMTRGCCSWHKGVCGCDDGRTVCCDGSYSPSCGC